VHRAPAELRDDRVAGFFDPKPALDRGALLIGERDEALASEEVRRCEQVNVQRVALDPLAAVVEAPERANGRMDLDAEDPLERMNRAHLVGDGTDAADACDEIRNLAGLASAEQRLEEARRLENPKPEVADPPAGDGQMQRHLAFDAGQVIKPYRSGLFSLRWHDLPRAMRARIR
jgi:hypothetical protein